MRELGDKFNNKTHRPNVEKTRKILRKKDMEQE
jgi:hypothetical protein